MWPFDNQLFAKYHTSPSVLLARLMRSPASDTLLPHPHMGRKNKNCSGWRPGTDTVFPDVTSWQMKRRRGVFVARRIVVSLGICFSFHWWNTTAPSPPPHLTALRSSELDFPATRKIGRYWWTWYCLHWGLHNICVDARNFLVARRRKPKYQKTRLIFFFVHESVTQTKILKKCCSRVFF